MSIKSPMSGLGTVDRPTAPGGAVGKGCATLFLLAFAGFGLVFVWLAGRDAIGSLKLQGWKRTDCVILASSVGEPAERRGNDGDFHFEVSYRYSFDGQSFVSSQYKRKPKTFSDYGKAAELAQKYKTGTSASCYVNPGAPGEAVLERDNPLGALVVLFPMVFVFIGAGAIYFVWRKKAGDETEPISERARPQLARGLPAILFGLFFVMGSVFLYIFLIRPVTRIVRARDWPAVPCVVISSEVKTHSDSDGSTYSVNVFYRYSFNGREFKSNRYNFMGGSSSGYDSKREIVNRLPPGTETICYVNPNEPTQAVLERGFTWEMWFGLIPLAFVGIGGGGLFFTLRKKMAASAGSVQGFPPASGLPVREPHLRVTSETRELRPKASPMGKLVAVILIALFWNGIVSVFVAQMVKGWRSGHAELFLTLFMIPFVLIGLALFGGIVYSFLALFNPRPRLLITPGAVPLGGTLRLQWEIAGRIEVLENLRVRLEGREEATYRRGTDTLTDKSVFADIEIARLTPSGEMRSGSRNISIPAGLMHSFEAKNNKIVWTIKLHGEIARWPDVKEEFAMTVLPQERKTSEAQALEWRESMSMSTSESEKEND